MCLAIGHVWGCVGLGDLRLLDRVDQHDLNRKERNHRNWFTFITLCFLHTETIYIHFHSTFVSAKQKNVFIMTALITAVTITVQDTVCILVSEMYIK